MDELGPWLSRNERVAGNLRMESLVVGLVIAAAVGAAALVARSRRRVDAPTQREFTVPTQLDTSDFGSPGQEWMVIVFTSSTCAVCADVSAKAEALTSPHVATRIVDYESQRNIHARYGIDAVPTLVIVDRTGVVHDSFLGPVTATDLWAAVARVRDGGETDEHHCNDH